jgi:membrane protein involved in colicin uptake
MGPECSSAPDDPIWTDSWQIEIAGDQFDTAQAYPEVIETANKFLVEQIILEEKTAAAELKAKQDAEAKAAAELKAKQDAEAKAAAELKAKQESEAKAATTKKTTITCLKGKLVKKVTATKPVCPKGYKKK